MNRLPAGEWFWLDAHSTKDSNNEHTAWYNGPTPRKKVLECPRAGWIKHDTTRQSQKKLPPGYITKGIKATVDTDNGVNNDVQMRFRFVEKADDVAKTICMVEAKTSGSNTNQGNLKAFLSH